jgi:hypothetical protein
MGAISQAIYNRLSGDATLTALLSTYRTSPAIFTSAQVPEDVSLPFIVSRGSLSDEPFESKDMRGRQIMRDIYCYARGESSTVAIETISERVRTLFHRQPLTVTGYTNIIAIAHGPTVMQDEDHIIGHAVTLELYLST